MTNEELVERIRAGENVPENMAALYDQTRGFIHSLVWKYRESGIMEDLEQEGFLALYPAIENYDPTAGVKFLTYAGFWIKQRIGRYMAENSAVHLPAGRLEQIQQCKRFCNAYRLEYGENPPIDLVAYYLNVSRESVREIEKNAYIRGVLSLNAPMAGANDGDDLEYMDTLTAGDVLEDEVADKVDGEALSALLWGYVDELPDNQPEIIKRRYRNDQTFTQIAKAQGTEGYVIRREYDKAIRHLRSVASENLRPFLPEAEEFDKIYSMALAGNGVERFNQTWTSSTERTALRL